MCHLDKEKENEQLQVKFDALTEKAKQQKAQIQKLEEDLLQGYATQAQGGALEDSGASTALPRTDSMLKIVCSQRDRVQSKLQKTEEVTHNEQLHPTSKTHFHSLWLVKGTVAKSTPNPEFRAYFSSFW